MAARWSCSRCTFENEPHAISCGICLYKRVIAPSASKTLSSMKATRSPAPKKPRTNASSSSARGGGGGVQSMLLSSVGSSKEQEAKRLAKKIQQMRELGIELSDERIAELLARNCYSVHVAASEYFERMTREETASDSASDATQSAAARAAARDPHVAMSVAYFEKGFLGAPFRLLGSTTAKALITRANARLSVGDQLLFQGENVGKKRARPSSATTAAPSTATSVSNSPSSTNSPSMATAAGSASANGIVRVSTTDHVQLGRLDRELEVVFHPLLKEGLVSLGGVCVEPPFSKAVFASFSIVLFVYVHPRAFDIFQEDHALFHLSDALYYVLDSIHSSTGGTTPLTQALSVAAKDGDDNDGEAKEVPRDLETLFSAFTGASSDDGAAEAARAADELAPMFSNGFELRSHQKQALSWMLWRERQAASDGSNDTTADTSSSVDSNPMWEKRLLHSQEVYYINPFEKIASLKPPSLPTPCLGGILADDMGMGKTIMLLSLITHRKHFSNETTSSSASSSPSKSPSPAKLASKPRIRAGNTLIVCPLSLLHQWKNEIDERFRAQTLSVLVYYGDERGSGTLSTKSDIVLTTYGVLCSEFEKSASSSVLLTTHWDRVILDEAHSIKTRTTTYFRACSSLRATHRWCLTGTPLQNSLSDLFSLLCFLRYEPWSRVSWWQRVIARPFEQGDEDALARLKVLLKPILLRRTKLSRDAHGNSIVELPPKTIEIVRLQFSEEERTFYQAVYDRSRAEFNGFVVSGTSMSSYIAIFALLLRLRQACNHPFLALGRNSELADAKKSGQGTGSQDSSMSQALRLERLVGESMESYFRRISSRLHEDAAVVEATTSKRQSSALSSAPALSSQYIQNVLTQIQEEGIDAQECPVCLDPPSSGVLTPCAHLLCEQCLRDSVANDPDGGCPVCRVPVEMHRLITIDAAATSTQAPLSASESDAHPGKGEDGTDGKSGSAESSSSSLFLSAKLRRLVEDLRTIREEDAAASAAATPDAPLARRRKVVVFSQWTHMLEMVAELLAQHGFGSCMFHGAMSQENREKVLRKFHQDESVDVLVISLKAGGVGLNLTCASVVVLLDPWWNPGVEDQAIDRVHRLGQTREVVVKRYVVEETVEQMILQLQERKEKLAKNVLVVAKSADDRAGERLGMEDLLAFFK